MVVWSGIAENGSVKCTSGCSGWGRIWWVVCDEVVGGWRGGTWCCRRRLLAECRMMSGSWVKSKVAKKVSIGFQVSTPLLVVSTIHSSSGRGVIGKLTFLKWMVWTVEDVGIILAVRGIYEGEEGSSLRAWVVAMARGGIGMQNTKNRGSSEAYSSRKTYISQYNNGERRNQCEM